MSQWILLLSMLTFLGAIIIGFSRTELWMRPRLRLAVLFLAVVLVALGVGCSNYVNPININPVVNGTPAGNFSIQLTGALGNNSQVTRTTVVSLSVLP